jgi:hypothetical protein
VSNQLKVEPFLKLRKSPFSWKTQITSLHKLGLKKNYKSPTDGLNPFFDSLYLKIGFLRVLP